MKSYTKQAKAEDTNPQNPKEVPVETKTEVPGVPGTKAESGHYGGGYIACPACKLTYKLEDRHFVNPNDEDGDMPAKSKRDPDVSERDDKDKVEPYKREPQAKKALKDGEKDTVDPVEPEDQVKAKTAMSFTEWRDAKIGVTKRAKTPFQEAVAEWQGQSHNLGTI